MINPVVLKRFTSFWLAKEQITFLNQTLAEIKQYTGKDYLIKHPIQRIFHDEGERELWKKKMKDEGLKDFLHPVFEDLHIVKNPYSSGRVNHSARLSVQSFFEDILAYLYKNEYLINEIEEIEKMFQETYNDEYPPEPLHEDNLRKYIFVNRVLVSARLLQKELEGKYIFYFEWERWENELKRLEQEIGL